MKRQSRAAQSKAVLALLCMGAATAAAAADYDDYGRVVNVTPQVEQFNSPRQECRTEYAPVQQPRQARGMGGSIIGGIAGGILGNQVGGGNGRTAATAAGAIAGAIVGDRMENNQNQPEVVTEQPVRHCRTVDNWQSRTNGYAVTYEYHGRTYTSVMPYDPGERVRLRVSVAPQL
ncbi:glycine zipper 2TM domain-containing protein [Noviherbaspirillum cavernae]|uniref:Glycine zipper 2TM domain-containing protein n=1 Tax=Noviherbaspirillum cavernae TaxID=2320862 RepID=A0A418X2H8_9BURK|nr:glycine zipper 2TM domain-containing protein [Noviherbaspirillum cavernae]RJG06621.1 glycine zipper 2TM domain-containing protein [Noviherbaspirillum cavernae]